MNKINGTIYKLTNKIDEKFYIGQTKRPVNQRFIEHMRADDHCIKLNAAVKKYGKNNFFLEIIDTAETLEELNLKEISYIKAFDAINKGYNLLSGGSNRPMTQEIKDKISKSQIGRKPTEKALKALLESNKIKIYQYSLTGEFLKSYDCIKTARETIKLPKSNIGAVASGKRRTAGNFQWRYHLSDNIGPVRNKLNPNLKGNRRRPEKSIELIDKNGQILKKYKSITEATKEFDISVGGIAAVCRKQRNSVYGLLFRFSEIE